jgi:hypothetical protein
VLCYNIANALSYSLLALLLFFFSCCLEHLHSVLPIFSSIFSISPIHGKKLLLVSLCPYYYYTQLLASCAIHLPLSTVLSCHPNNCINRLLLCARIPDLRSAQNGTLPSPLTPSNPISSLLVYCNTEPVCLCYYLLFCNIISTIALTYYCYVC